MQRFKHRKYKETQCKVINSSVVAQVKDGELGGAREEAS